jgi:uncharacterized protein YndB with AHSA1/START domain
MGAIKRLLHDHAETIGDWDYDYEEYLQRWSSWTERMTEHGRKARHEGIERRYPKDLRFIALGVEIAFATGAYLEGEPHERIVAAWNSGWDEADRDLAQIAEHEELEKNRELGGWIASMYA